MGALAGDGWHGAVVGNLEHWRTGSGGACAGSLRANIARL
jgi:hypothetical protein